MQIRDIKNLRRSVIVVDDFFSDPSSLVEYAKTLDYVYPYTPEAQAGDKVAWMASRFRSAKNCPLKSSDELILKLEEITQSRIDRENWNLDYPVDERGYPIEGYGQVPVVQRSAWWNCTFHAKFHAGQKPGDGVHDHSDRDGWNAVGRDGWVGLVYLSKDAPLDRGLHTWRNKFSDSERFTDASHWQKIDSFANVYNRLILHRGDLPHSGSPGWGNSIENGRLFLTLFARTIPDRKIPSVDIRSI